MLDYRRQERKQKQLLADAQLATKNSDPLAELNENDKMFVEHVLSKFSAGTAISLPKEIMAADPFDAFPVKVKPYMLDILSACKSRILNTDCNTNSFTKTQPRCTTFYTV
jgi:hypothetical protein